MRAIVKLTLLNQVQKEELASTLSFLAKNEALSKSDPGSGNKTQEIEHQNQTAMDNYQQTC